MQLHEERSYIKDEDIEWMVHTSQLSPRMERKINPNSSVGLVNGLAVYGPNTGALLEIEVTVIPDKRKRVRSILQELSKKKVLGITGNRFVAKVWQRVRLKMYYGITDDGSSSR